MAQVGSDTNCYTISPGSIPDQRFVFYTVTNTKFHNELTVGANNLDFAT